MDTPKKPLNVSVLFSYRDLGLEWVCDILLDKPSLLTRTRMFFWLVARSFSKTMECPTAPTNEQLQFWMESDERVKVNLHLNHYDPMESDLFEYLSSFPDHQARAHAIRRLLFDASNTRSANRIYRNAEYCYSNLMQTLDTHKSCLLNNDQQP